VATLLMFAHVREISGCGSDEFAAETLAALLEQAKARYGARFAEVLVGCRVWVNGQLPAAPEVVLAANDEVAVIPPIAGG
jgi:molybdopterin converting factor small subunit